MKTLTVILALLFTSPSYAQIDTAVADGWVLALGPSGDVWHQNDCSYSDWRYVADFPGAYLIDNSNIGVVICPSQMQMGYFRLDLEPWFDYQKTINIPAEVGVVLDIDVCARVHDYAALLTTANGSWLVIFSPAENSPSFWSGPCPGLPDGPVNVMDETWGKIKERYR